MPNSSTWPFCKTNIMPQSLMVFKRWAIVITVESFSFSRITLQIVSVGSSKMTILFCCNSTRAKQMSCRSLKLTRLPFSNNVWSSCPSRLKTNCFSCTSFKARYKSVSSNCPEHRGLHLAIHQKGQDFGRERIYTAEPLAGSVPLLEPLMMSPLESSMHITAATNDDFPDPWGLQRHSLLLLWCYDWFSSALEVPPDRRSLMRLTRWYFLRWASDQGKVVTHGVSHNSFNRRHVILDICCFPHRVLSQGHCLNAVDKGKTGNSWLERANVGENVHLSLCVPFFAF